MRFLKMRSAVMFALGFALAFGMNATHADQVWNTTKVECLPSLFEVWIEGRPQFDDVAESFSKLKQELAEAQKLFVGDFQTSCAFGGLDFEIQVSNLGPNGHSGDGALRVSADGQVVLDLQNDFMKTPTERVWPRDTYDRITISVVSARGYKINVMRFVNGERKTLTKDQKSAVRAFNDHIKGKISLDRN